MTARLGEAQIQADRIEFDTGFRTLFARGSVRLQRGNQFFQASVLRYNLVQNEGELDDVYGVIDLEGTPTTPQEAAKKPKVVDWHSFNGSHKFGFKQSNFITCKETCQKLSRWRIQILEIA